MKLTSAKLVTHFSNSESTNWQEQHADHASTFGLSSILLTELSNGPQSTHLLIRAKIFPAIYQTLKMDQSVPLGPNENEICKTKCKSAIWRVGQLGVHQSNGTGK